MAHVAHVPHLGRTGTAAIVAAVLGAGAAVGGVAITGELSDQASAPAQGLPAGAAYVQPTPSAPLSASDSAARYHTPR